MARSGPEDGGERAQQIEAVVREIESAVLAIERYLDAHPNASDTLQGVRDWWLAGLGRPSSVDVIQAALDRLVESRILQPRPIPGGVVYGRWKQQDDE